MARHGRAGGSWGAFIWDEEEGMLNLNSLLAEMYDGWQVAFADDINIHGQIVGTGFKDGQRRAVLLTPVNAAVPEPASVALFGVGLILLAGLRQTQQRFRRHGATSAK